MVAFEFVDLIAELPALGLEVVDDVGHAVPLQLQLAVLAAQVLEFAAGLFALDLQALQLGAQLGVFALERGD